MKDKLQLKLKAEGRSLRWFHTQYITPIKTGMTYNALALQLNGYAVVCDDVKRSIKKYLNE